MAACSVRNQRITAAEGVAVDAAGNVYGAVVVTPGVNKYVRM
jgi:hypothetical protein